MIRQRKILAVLIVAFLVSCSSYKKDRFVYNEFTWTDQFKAAIFLACIKESYKGDSIYEQMGQRDIFFANDAFHGQLGLINELGEHFVKKIPLPKRPCPECKKEDRYFLANCLKYYESRELDSIAKAEYKTFLKHKKSQEQADAF